MRLVDALLSVPLIITALIAVVALGSSRVTLILVIGIVFAPIIARTVRAAVLGERELEYVQAARLRNERAPYVMFAEILPNVSAPIVVEFTVRLGYAIFAIATLSFLGFGADPSIPDWGKDIAEHYQFINGGIWWAVLFPSLAIATMIVGINLIADAISQSFER
jgi:peptide/nickel transport system permease protein